MQHANSERLGCTCYGHDGHDAGWHSFTRKKLHDLPRDAMMQLLLAAFLFGTALAELRVWNRSTFTGQQGTLAASFGAWW